MPDLATLRMLPWNPTHGMAHAVLCTSPAQPWACCPRTALRRALALLLKETGLGLQVGFEVEFTLLHKPEPSLAGGMQALRPVDAAVYCQTTAYDAVSPVLDEMCAALEAMAHQTYDLKTAFAADGADWAELRIDGGMVTNDWMAQDLADMLAIDVERPAFVETTALGAAMLAAVGCGLYHSLEEAAKMRGGVTRFAPTLDPSAREIRLAGWADALSRVLR